MSEKDIVVDALLALNKIAQSFSEQISGVRKEFQAALQKENKELEMQNQAQALAGHNKELQDGIIAFMKVYQLSAIDALQLLEKLSYKPALPNFDEAVQESGTCEEPGGIDDVMQDVYTSGEEDKDKLPFHEDLIARLHRRLDCKMNKEDLLLYRSISQTIRAGKEAKDEREQLRSELRDIERYVFKFFDGSYTSVEYERLPHTSEEFNVIVKRLMELSGWAKKEEYTSGEDPGDTHEPSKGSGTPNYERILEKLGWFLDCGANLSHYSLYNEIKDILKEHQQQNARIKYGTPKKAGPFGHVAVIGEPLQENEMIVPLQEHKNNVPLFAPPKLGMPGETTLADIDTIESETREYQRNIFKDMNITFKNVETNKVICSLDIDATLKRCDYLSKGAKVNLAYIEQTYVEMYNIVEIVQKKYPSHELLVMVKELRKYD